MRSGENSKRITGFAALLVFAAFALCILGVLLGGAKIYRVVTERQRQSYDVLTAEQYITTRVRQGDSGGEISVEDFGGVSALCIGETIDGAAYVTRVYCRDGGVYELFSEKDGDFSPEDGERVLSAESLSFTLNGRELTVSLTAGGEEREFTLYLRSGEGGSP